MRQGSQFKNPEEDSDDELDELEEELEVVGEENDFEATLSEPEENGDVVVDERVSPSMWYSESEDYSEFDLEDSDSSLGGFMTEESVSTETNATQTQAPCYVDQSTQTEKNTAITSNKQTGTDIAGVGVRRNVTVGTGCDVAVGEDEKSVFDLNEDEEDDETVRAMIAAFKKPRVAPPDIKLDDFITDICFHPEEQMIALATITGDVYLYRYNNEANEQIASLELHAKACRDVEFTEDGLSLLSCSKDKCIMVVDVETEKLKKFYESAHDDAINKMHIVSEHLFATGDDSGTVKLWDLRTKNPIFALKEVEDYITSLLTNDAKKFLLVTSGDGYLTTINIGARKLYVQSEPYEEEMNCMGIYRGDSKLVVGTSKGRLYTYNWGQFGYHCDMFPGVKTPISQMIPITDRIGCVAGEEGVIRACHIAPYRNLGIVGQHSMPIESLDVSWNGELIASSSHNNDVSFWNVKYFEEFGEIRYNEKHNPIKEKRHNLPSSKFTNNSDFFADLAGPSE